MKFLYLSGIKFLLKYEVSFLYCNLQVLKYDWPSFSVGKYSNACL